MPKNPRSEVHRLLCCSDTHDRLPPALPEDGAAAWLHAGDVYEDPRFGGEQLPAAADWQDPDHPDVAAWAETRKVPVFGVRGNHDFADPFRFFASGRNLSGRAVRLAKDLVLAGVGWAGDDVCPPFDRELAEVCAHVAGAVDRVRVDGDRIVLVSHYPGRVPGLFPDDPFGRLSDFCFPCVTELVLAIEPVVVVQGHIHQWAGHQAKLKLAGGRTTLVVALGPAGAVVEVGVGRAVRAKVFPAKPE
ncbi:MAG: metallophosphoesterase [Myxococcales bacterium]